MPTVFLKAGDNSLVVNLSGGMLGRVSGLKILQFIQFNLKIIPGLADVGIRVMTDSFFGFPPYEYATTDVLSACHNCHIL